MGDWWQGDGGTKRRVGSPEVAGRRTESDGGDTDTDDTDAGGSTNTNGDDTEEPASLDRLRPADAALLESLRRGGAESLPLLAGRAGVHLKYADRRCRVLETHGYVRQTSGRYELTERGARRLDSHDAG